MIDYSKIQQDSAASSNKVLKEGAGIFTVPALSGAGDTFGVATIAHNFGSDNLLYQVSTSSAVIANTTILPWAPNDNRQIQYATVDTTNLYIYFISTDSSGLGNIGYTVSYYYRLLIP